MTALFAHDHRFIPTGDETRSESQFESSLWHRYLAHFDELTVVARRGALPDGVSPGDLKLSSAANVSFELFGDLSTLRGLTVDRPGAIRRMTDLVKTHDAVIARLPSEIGLLAVQAARATGTPHAIEVVGCSWDGLWNYGSLKGRLYAPIAMQRLRRAVRAADHVIYVTSSFLQGRYPTGAAHVSFASNVGIGDASPEALGRRLERIAMTGDRVLHLGLIGTLRTRYKGIQTAIAALAQLPPDSPRFHLHVLGEGDVRPWLALAERHNMASHVTFEGTLPGGDPVMRWLDEVDIYLQPSLQEGLPRALVEAMSRGCPAIGSTAGGIPELLPSEDLIRPGDTRALSQRLQEVMRDRDWMVASATRNWEEAT